MLNRKPQAILLALGRNFKYETLSSKLKRMTFREKVVEPYELEKDAEVVFESSRSARFALTRKKLDSGTHFYHPSEGIELPATTYLVFPRKRFAELVNKGATTWMAKRGEDLKPVKLSRIRVPAYRAKVEGSFEELPAIGAKGGGIALTILDDARCPLLLASDEKMFPLRLLEIGKPADKKMPRLGPWPRRT